MQLDAGEVSDVDPAEIRDVGNAIFVADKVGACGEAGIKDAVEPLGFAYVALGRVGDAFFSQAVEARLGGRRDQRAMIYKLGLDIPYWFAWPCIGPRPPVTTLETVGLGNNSIASAYRAAMPPTARIRSAPDRW